MDQTDDFLAPPLSFIEMKVDVSDLGLKAPVWLPHLGVWLPMIGIYVTQAQQ